MSTLPTSKVPDESPPEVPSMVIRRARTIAIRVIGSQPTLDRMFSAWRTIERTGFG